MFKKYQHIHFVGIGGIGMSGIAEVLLNLGYHVTGSDLKENPNTNRLAKKGATIKTGHDRQNIEGAHVVVVSSAIKKGNPEVLEAGRRGIAVVPRAEMLSELMRLKYSVVVAGTHGKTSTTSLIGSVLSEAGLDPTLIIGGRVNSLSSNAKLGRGEFLVAESDESDRSFLKLAPTIGVITNIDPEHMESYRDFDDLQTAFLEFANNVPFYGAVVACSAHKVVSGLMGRMTRPIVSYGGKGADYTAHDVRQDGLLLSFDAHFKGEKIGRVELKMAGFHNAQNALATIAVGRHLDIPFDIINFALAKFEGVGRRFQVLHRDTPMVVDDYAHHPVEIEATISAARAGWPNSRLVVVLQPHRFTRLKAHFDSFVRSVKNADGVVVMDVYPAGESPLKNYTGEKLWREISRCYPEKKVEFAKADVEVMKELKKWQGREDMIVFLGAGSVTETARQFAKSLG